MKKLSLILLGFLGTGLIAMDAPDSSKLVKPDPAAFTKKIDSLQFKILKQQIDTVFNIADPTQFTQAHGNLMQLIGTYQEAMRDQALQEARIAYAQRVFTNCPTTPLDQRIACLKQLLPVVRQHKAQYKDGRLAKLESEIMNRLSAANQRAGRGRGVFPGRQLVLPNN